MEGAVDMSGLRLDQFAQVGFVVHDVEATKRRFAELFGVPVPPTVDCGEYEVTRTVYKGQAAPNAFCRMAFFRISDSIEIELIEPNEEPSTWRDFLNEHGEGVHHLAFHVKGMDEARERCENYGMELLQYGEYGSADGRYAYYDGEKDLKCIIELLESDEQL